MESSVSSDRLEQVREALRGLGFEVACTDSVLLGDHPVPIAEIAAHGLPWVLANWFRLDAGGTPPAPMTGYPQPTPPNALALPTEPQPPRRHQKTDDAPLEELTGEELWGDSSLWGETSMIGEDHDDDELMSPFEAGFRSDDDIDDQEDDRLIAGRSPGGLEPIGPIAAPDGALIVWVPEEFSDRLMKMLGITADGNGEPDPDAVMRLMRVLRHLQRKREGDAANGLRALDASDTSDLSDQERRMLDAFGLGERTSTDWQDPSASGDDDYE